MKTRIAALNLCVGMLLLANSLACTPPEEQSQPNFLFYIADDMSPFVDSQDIPAFRAVGANGITFSHAFTNAPSCTPARGILLTGRPLWELRDGSTLFGSITC